MIDIPRLGAPQPAEDFDEYQEVYSAYKVEKTVDALSERIAELEAIKLDYEKTLDANAERAVTMLEDAQTKIAELEANQLPIENGRNRYGVDVSYFRNAINRELNRGLSDFKPSELARVFARLSVTADSSVILEAEFIKALREDK